MYDSLPLSHNPDTTKKLPGSATGPVPAIRIYGVTDKGNSVMAHVHGVTPYFYCSMPSNFQQEHIATWRASLNEAVRRRESAPAVKSFLRGAASMAGASRGSEELVRAVMVVEKKQSLFGYHGKATTSFLQVYMAMPGLVPAAKRILEDGFSCPGYPTQPYQCFEANMPFVLRYMIDNDISGCNWLEMPAGTYAVRPGMDTVAARESGSSAAAVAGTPAGATLQRGGAGTGKLVPGKAKATSYAQIELDIVFDSIISHAAEGEWQRIAPARILSFDIECASRKGHFPAAEHDPVIQIANTVTLQGETTSSVRNVFVLNSCSPIVGTQVLTYENEAELLADWARFVRVADPDIITGYNIQNFDIPYVLKRSETLKCQAATFRLGRLQGDLARMRNTTFQSSAHGKRENIETSISGRVMFDMLNYMRRNHKLSSYSLNAVSAEFLGQQKEDVHHSIISDLFKGGPEDRHRLAVYCLKDAFLPQRLMDKLMVMVNHIEMARVTGVPLDFLLSRGQQIKVLSMLFRKCRPKGLLVPTLRKGGGGEDVTFEGATVIEPMKGFYNEPIATLDFASLYPSIMMAHNLCYSTLVAREDVAQLPEEAYQRTPTGDIFVRASTHKGVLPEILEELLAARKRAKKDMKAATDPMVHAVQNGRQLALKISANSVYGFTGATVGQLPCLAISSSVTSFGRDMIDQTKGAVERLYTVANGYPADAIVVYGDTDSVMVKFGVPDVATAMKMGEEAATEVTKLFPNPVRLEFEKVYFPYLLMNKKRYAGMYWTNPHNFDKMDAKGIETVRRDNCALVRQVVSTVLRKILMERSVGEAVAYTKRVIADLLQNKLDISLLVITKALGKSANSEGYTAKQAHVELAERMRKRDAGNAPSVGDRVPYVLIRGPKGAPAYTKSEDPVYVVENNIPIDTEHYLTNQLSKPLMRIFGPIIENPESLLHGEHTKKISKATPSARKGSIMMFASKKEKCMFPGCNVPLTSRKLVCAAHAGREGDVYRSQLSKVNHLESNFSRLWTQCQRCQGSLHQDVICSACDCPIFYMRKKVAKDLNDAHTELAKFDVSW